MVNKTVNKYSLEGARKWRQASSHFHMLFISLERLSFHHLLGKVLFILRHLDRPSLLAIFFLCGPLFSFRSKTVFSWINTAT